MGIVNWYLNWCDRWMPGYSRPPDPEEIEEAPCDRCEELIHPNESACPECGNYPFKSAKWAGVGLMLAGLILSFTVIGAIIGIPLFIIGAMVRLGASNLSPTEYDFNTTR